MTERALVLRGSRNLFTLRGAAGEYECRLKGKVLKGVEGFYNPLAPGDVVEADPAAALITALEPRRNAFARFNQKGLAPQLLAANVDLVVGVTTSCSPPFRPRFLDRLLFQADYAGIPAALVCNKRDLLEKEDLDVEERLEDFRRIGCPVFRLSARTGEGLAAFRAFIAGKLLVLAGQSGVGKSSLIAALAPELAVRTGPLNRKFDRGNHTTVQPVLLEAGDLRIIDTPGIRRFAPERVSPPEVLLYMREFAPLAGRCSFGLSCGHETEPGCKILEAVHAGVIHEERYESFLRIRDEMAGGTKYPDYD